MPIYFKTKINLHFRNAYEYEAKMLTLLRKITYFISFYFSELRDVLKIQQNKNSKTVIQLKMYIPIYSTRYTFFFFLQLIPHEQ